MLDKITQPNTLKEIPLSVLREKKKVLASYLASHPVLPEHYQVSQNMAKLLYKHLENDAPLTVLELGCATGIHALALYQNNLPVAKIIGVDIEDTMLEQAQKRQFNDKSIYYKVLKTDCYSTYLNATRETFHVVYVHHEILSCQRHPQSLINAIIRIIRPHGFILCYQPEIKKDTTAFRTEYDDFVHSTALLEKCFHNAECRLIETVNCTWQRGNTTNLMIFQKKP